MLSINTNLSSLIAQRSMSQSTNALDLAIERMSTGFKINHSRDNAANYSISNNMTTQIGSYNVAEDNCAMGLDMLTTANGGLDLISRKLKRLRELALQSANDTYGSESQKAINAEAKAIVDEVKRVYNTAEYNGKKLFNEESKNTAGLTTPTYSSQEVANMTTLTKAIENSSLTTGGEYSISSAEELAKLAEIVNNGTNTSGITFVLANDIDLADWCAEHADTGGWNAIGKDSTNAFKGTFDGNGHVIENLTIDKETADYQGLFGYTKGATIKNVGLENADVHGNSFVASLIARASNSSIENNYTTGTVNAKSSYVGGLAGYLTDNSTITNCYAVENVKSNGNAVGGLVGYITKTSSIINCYASGDVYSEGITVGGLVGYVYSTSIITNCYFTGSVYGRNYAGGLAGMLELSAQVLNCYSDGRVLGNSKIGGLVGASSGSTINNSYCTGFVKGEQGSIGGLVGINQNNAIVSNCYSLGQVSGKDNSIGTLVGSNGVADGITDCASLGGVKIGSDAETGDVLTLEEIQARYTDEAMGFTEENGWVIINGKQYIKGLVPSGVVANTSLQIGINSNSNSQIVFNMGFALDGINSLSGIGKYLDCDYLSIIDNMLETINAKQTKFGSIQNRLESVLDEIVISRDNLTSSRSTLKDADISKVSSEYIKHQILQQASATLMATANQTPSIALQLI